MSTPTTGALKAARALNSAYYIAYSPSDPEFDMPATNQQIAEIIDRETGVLELLDKAKSLRAAQRAYMAYRGNIVLGEAVGVAARELDAAIAHAEGKA